MAEIKIMDNGKPFIPKIELRELSPLLLDNPCASTNSLLLPYNTDNGQDGIMFDVIATNNIIINCFEGNFGDGTYDIEIYSKPGTCVGYETDSVAWSLIGSANSVVSSGVDLPTYIPISVNYPIFVGQTVAFYITTVSGETKYTDGSFMPGVVFDSNADLSITEGYGKEYPFLDSFDPRRFNGTIYYDLISISAGTEYTVCVICEDCCGSGTTATTVNPPHPTWTRPDGNAVVLLDAVQLGGMFGLNS